VDRLLKQTKKLLFDKIIPWAGSNHATSRIWPAGRMFDTPVVDFAANFQVIDKLPATEKYLAMA